MGEHKYWQDVSLAGFGTQGNPSKLNRRPWLQVLDGGCGNLAQATAMEPAVARAPATIICTGTYWRNAWKYQARTYRHFGWDSGTFKAAQVVGTESPGSDHLSCLIVTEHRHGGPVPAPGMSNVVPMPSRQGFLVTLHTVIYHR